MASGFGTDKSSSSSSQTKTTQAPPNFTTDMGSLVYGKKSGYTYNSKESDANKQARATTENSLNSLLSGIPTSFNINDAYNNPYYGTFKDFYTQPLQSQQAEDQRALRNRLSAQNQLGSSVDAYQNYLQNKQYNSAYQQAEQQARLGSADAYNQMLNNQLNTLGALRNDYGQQLNAYYQPLQFALGAQSTFAPYAQTTVNGSQTNTNSPSLLSQYSRYIGANAQALAGLGGVV